MVDASSSFVVHSTMLSPPDYKSDNGRSSGSEGSDQRWESRACQSSTSDSARQLPLAMIVYRNSHKDMTATVSPLLRLGVPVFAVVALDPLVGPMVVVVVVVVEVGAVVAVKSGAFKADTSANHKEVMQNNSSDAPTEMILWIVNLGGVTFTITSPIAAALITEETMSSSPREKRSWRPGECPLSIPTM